VKGIRLVIEGRVQGVAYRDWTRRRAEALGLCGWVRNRRNGTVEAVFTGDDAAVEKMVEACRDGPPAAAVTAVRIVSQDEPPEADFEILSTQ
jgi:acylphosphatase